MTWILLLFVVALAIWPFAREALKPSLSQSDRAKAPGAFVELSQGVTHYRWIGPNRGPVVVCVHGLTTPSFVWGGLARGLSSLGFRVLIYDLYGRGHSDRPGGLQDRQFFVTQLEDLLEDQLVEGDFTLIGYSMGGAVATVFASAHPNRIRQLVLIASAGVILPESRMRKVVQTVPLLGRWLMYAMYPRNLKKGIAAERDMPSSVPDIGTLQTNELRLRGFMPAVFSSIRGLLAENLDEDHAALHKAGVPVLAVWGRDDDVIPISASGRLAEISRNARQDVIDGAGHGLTYTHSNEILNALRETLRDGLT